MDNLNIDIELLDSVSKQIASKADEFASLLEKIKEYNTSLREYWEGQDAKSYLDTVETQATSLNELRDAIYELGGILARTAKTYQAISDENM